MENVERLRQYQNFSDEVMLAVSEAAARQAGLSFAELADHYGIADGPQHPETSFKPIEVLALRPDHDYDEHFARVYQAPIDVTAEAMATRAMRLFEADPSSQLIVVGNPASLGNQYNKLNLKDWRRVARGDLTPAVEPQLAYLANIGLSSVVQLGFSYGADKAMAASGSIAKSKYGIEVQRCIAMEPVSIVNRNLFKLWRDFMAAGSHLEDYKRAADNALVREERTHWHPYLNKEFLAWAGGLLRASNLGIESALAKDGFTTRVKHAMANQRGLKVGVAWGTASELVPNDTLASLIDHLKSREHSIESRILGLPLWGMHHAGGDDIDLHAAIVLQTLAMLK